MFTKVVNHSLVMLVIACVGCSESSFVGNPHKSKEPEADTGKLESADPTFEEPAGEVHQKPPVSLNREPISDPDPVSAPPIPDTVAPPPPPPREKAPEVVDGLEVVDNCGQCLRRATQMSARVGFVADMRKTINVGFYKIDPARNLCDIHFMADLTIPIDDHEGEDGFGYGQVILYCPCNCRWAVDLSAAILP